MATTQPGRFIRFLETSQVEIGHRGLSVEPVSIQLAKDSSVDLDRVEGITSVADFAASGRRGHFGLRCLRGHGHRVSAGRVDGFPDRAARTHPDGIRPENHGAGQRQTG